VSWLLIGLAVLPLIVVVLLAIPVRLRVEVERTDGIRAVWRVQWLFGLVDVRSDRARERPLLPPPLPEGRREEAPGRAPATSRSARGTRVVLAVLRTPGLLRRVAWLLRALVRQVKWETLSARIEFGFDDPADTGQVYGTLVPVQLLVARQGWDLHWFPEFTGAVLQGSGTAAVRVRPLSVLGVVVGFLLSPPVWRAGRAWWTSR